MIWLYYCLVTQTGGCLKLDTVPLVAITNNLLYVFYRSVGFPRDGTGRVIQITVYMPN